MRVAIRGVAATVVVGVMAILPGAASALDDARSPECVGLTCVAPSSSNNVPEARMIVPSVPGPKSLQTQRVAGFYEFGAGTGIGDRAVAYVVPDGQANRMPASIRRLPVVKATAESNGFQGATVVIFEAEVSLSLLSEPKAAMAARKRIRARASAADAYGCNDNYFCLYSSTYWVRSGWPMVQFGPSDTGEGFKRLSAYGFNDMARSMRNRRDRDSLLAEHWNGSTGTGTRYCADSHSSDTTFENNAIGNGNASAFANVPDDIHC